MAYINQFAKHYKQQQNKSGYYLVKTDGSRYFISQDVSLKALERVCDKVLSDTDYNYWIAYLNPCIYNVDGSLSWANASQQHRFE